MFNKIILSHKLGTAQFTTKTVIVVTLNVSNEFWMACKTQCAVHALVRYSWVCMSSKVFFVGMNFFEPFATIFTDQLICIFAVHSFAMSLQVVQKTQLFWTVWTTEKILSLASFKYFEQFFFCWMLWYFLFTYSNVCLELLCVVICRFKWEEFV